MTWVVGALAAAPSAWWALRPMNLPSAAVAFDTADRDAGAASQATSEPFDVKAFEARIWNSWRAGNASSSATASPESAGQALRLQLVGITQENGELHAALYDSVEDRLWIVRSGDRVRGRTVGKVTRAGVELSEGDATVSLPLVRLDR